MTQKIKVDEICAWCGIWMQGIGNTVADDHICMRCYRNHLIEKKKQRLFWKGVKNA
jgi:hypothetical protein